MSVVRDLPLLAITMGFFFDRTRMVESGRDSALSGKLCNAMWSNVGDPSRYPSSEHYHIWERTSQQEGVLNAPSVQQQCGQAALSCHSTA
eukprot:2524263-Amphidinium_carterae.3